MSELKATKGEWRWEDHEDDGQWLVSDEEGAEDGFGWIILETDDVKPEDASLLAAARALYEALLGAMETLENILEEEGYYTSDEEISEIRSVLTKARGEQQ